MEELLASAAMEPVDPVRPATVEAGHVPEQKSARSVRFHLRVPRGEYYSITANRRRHGRRTHGPACSGYELFCYLALAGRPVPPRSYWWRRSHPQPVTPHQRRWNMAATGHRVGAEYVPSAMETGYRGGHIGHERPGPTREAVVLARPDRR